jgi:hypothetical protein
MSKESNFNYPQQFEGKTNYESEIKDRLGFMQKLAGSKLMKKLNAYMLAGFFFLPAAVDKSHFKEQVGISQPSAKDRIPMQERGGGTNNEFAGLKSLGIDAHHTFTQKDKQGNLKFNPWALIAPLQIEVSADTKISREVQFDLPYEYSRNFDSGKPLRKEDHDKVAAYIEQQIRSQIGEALYGLDVSKRVHGVKHESESSHLDVKEISITGFASPEGPRGKGSETILSDNVDKENLDLAYKRAATAANLTEQTLNKLGLDEGKFQEMIKSIKADEIQFSEVEIGDLATLARDFPGADDIERIFNLIVEYNDDKISDPEAVKKLDQLVASKRKVEVAITTEGNKKHSVLIPVPWLIFLLPLLGLPRRRRAERIPEKIKKRDDIKKEDGGTIKEESAKQEVPNGPVRQIPLEIESTKLPNSESIEFERMEEQVIADDLYVFFDRKETMELGLNYRDLADNILKTNESFSSKEERMNFLASEILNAWIIHDINARRKAGVSENDLKTGLDYERQPNQIVWAKMHARSLLELVDEKIEIKQNNQKDKDYLELLQSKVRRMLQRRILRNE